MTTAAPETTTRTAGPRPDAPPPRRPRRPLPALATAAAALLTALALLAAAHHLRPAPYGDRLTVHPGPAGGEPALRKKGRAVVAYDRTTGRPRWTHTRDGRTPLAVLPAPGHAFTLWDDGLVTDTERRAGTAVRWHRALPAVADWLRTPGARAGAGVLRVLDAPATGPGHGHGLEPEPGSARAPGMLAVITPQRITAYRTADGDLRWVLPARSGCAFRPHRALRHGAALLVAQPCTDPERPWSEQVVAVDGLGRVVPDRKPLGNALPGGAGRVPGTGRATEKAPEKVVAHPR
ncbi:hypothetical protein [Streptomyces sp. Da 82-17]|uniref:hypothetical protein n=1 Tax=Streptomyces sp. Da 82-17 TaxID=3377116 RepID=UPI0038D41E4F